MSEKEQIEPLDNNSTDMNALQQELNTLKTTYADLESRYNTLNSEYNQYKFDIEFNNDISSVKSSLGDDELDTLKTLKVSGNEKAYNMLLNNISKLTNTGGIGNFGRGFNPSREQDVTPKDDIDAFTKAIKERKGE